MSVHHTKKDELRQSRTKRIRALSLIENLPRESSGRFLVYKERGEPLAVLVRRFRAEQGIDVSVPITYAGRLDPMAEGAVLLLVGTDRYHKDSLLGLAKTYEMEVLLGIATDTADVLGLIIRESYASCNTNILESVVARVSDITELPYPAYSSVLVEGKPLFEHTRKGNVVAIPTKKVTITESKLLRTRTAPVELIAREAIEDIGVVEGDFRQVSIMKQWKSYTETHHDKSVLIATVRITASSGTYMRSIAQWIGDKLGVPALAYRIKRTKIGEWGI